ncbi:hypothetical protein D3C86_1729710 [compost metagenome]
MGDEEIAATGLEQGLRDDIRTQAIGIGLDDGRRLRCWRHRREGQIIVAQCAEVDGQMTACTTGCLLAADLHIHVVHPHFYLMRVLQRLSNFLAIVRRKCDRIRNHTIFFC